MGKAAKPKVAKGGAYRGSQTGMRKLMKRYPIQGMIEEATEDITRMANAFDHGRFRAVYYEGEVSLHGYVFPADKHAENAQAMYDILQKSLYT